MTNRPGDVRTRLQYAALELFRTHGYDRTTAAGIAAQAGVTERTFFRYFPDKREVLFDGEVIVRAALTESIAGAPAERAPLDTLFDAFRAFEPMLKSKASYARPRHAVIATTPALHEREPAKMDALADALDDALRARGVADLRATLAARTSIAVFVHATLARLEDPKVSFRERIDVTARELSSLMAQDWRGYATRLLVTSSPPEPFQTVVWRGRQDARESCRRCTPRIGPAPSVATS